MMEYVLTLLAGLLIGGVLVWSYMKDVYGYIVACAQAKETAAHQASGRLAKRIHKQRLMIKTLKANQIPKPKKPVNQQVTVSH